MKNKYFFLSIIMVFILAQLLSGCTVRNPAIQPCPVPDQSPEQVQSLSQPLSEPGDTLKVHFIDVGQGDAILIQTPAGQNMLIDAGENDQGDVVINYLIAHGVQELEAVVGTHPHSDHIGGLDTIINRFMVKNVYLPKVTTTTQSFRDMLTAVKNRGLQISTARAGAVVPLNGVSCRIVAPIKDSYEDLNNYSAVIKLEYGTQSFLLTGDAGTESEAQMLNSGADLKSTVLKVGHHGSYSSSGGRFLSAVAPRYAVIMVGSGNSYGHPHAQTLARLNKIGAQIYRTDQNGTIVFTTNGQTMQVSKER